MSAFLSKLSAKNGIVNNGAESEVASGSDSKREKTWFLCPKLLQVLTQHCKNLVAVPEVAPGSQSKKKRQAFFHTSPILFIYYSVGVYKICPFYSK